MTNQFRLLAFTICSLMIFCVACSTQSATHSEATDRVQAITTENFPSLVLNSPKPVLVDFWAPWCGPCVQIKPIVESMAAEYSGKLIVGSINVDDHPGLAEEFDIASIPALLFFQDGKVVRRSVGAVSRMQLKSEIDAVLQ